MKYKELPENGFSGKGVALICIKEDEDMDLSNIRAWHSGTTGQGNRYSREIKVVKRGNRIIKKTILRDSNGNQVGTFSVSMRAKGTKRLQYNFKKISNRILAARTSGSAGKALTTAKEVIASLRRKLRCSEYDDQDLEHAILHAERMERVARKKIKHLKEEEHAKRQQGPCSAEMEEEGPEPEFEEAEELQDGLNEEELKALRQELKEMLENSAELMEDVAESDELTEKLVGVIREDMDPADLEQLKKKHRAKEMQEMIEADMKYLKAVFEKLAKEKQQASNGASSARQFENSSDSGVSLEIDGVDIAVAAPEAMPVSEGGSVDVSV